MITSRITGLQVIDDLDNLIVSPLFGPIQNYLLNNAKQHDRVFLIVPYIQKNALEKLLQGVISKIILVTTWRLEDLLSGSSDLDIYPFCHENGITLYINNRIHLKVYSVNLCNLILATANISEAGLGLNTNRQLECATMIEKINSQERLFLEGIIRSSIHVDYETYQKLLEWYKEQEKVIPIKESFEKIIPKADRNNFLVSSLPMTRDVATLEEGYQRINEGVEPSNDKEISDCVYHDLANYQISTKLDMEEFRQLLSDSFFSHPFIQKIEELISPETYFGRIKEWVQKNCTDVPVPSRRELTGNVQVLMNWFETLGPGKYVVDIPGSYSQRIRKVDNEAD